MYTWSPLPEGLSPAARRLAMELRALKDAHGLTFKQMGRMTHYSHASWERWLNGRRPVTQEALLSLVQALGPGSAHLLEMFGEDAEPLVAPTEEGRGPVGTRGPGAGIAQLPAVESDFVGRRAQIRRLSEALLRGGPGPGAVAIAAVSGGGGLGKTTLAVRTAHLVADHFPDGQLYADLRGATDSPRDPAEVAAGWLRALGDAADAIPPDPDERASALRSKLYGKRMLLVLDNARDAGHVRPLLPASSGCAVLVTSRNRLGDLPGAYRLELDPMPDADALAMLEQAVGAARLAAEPEACHTLVKVCAGWPLALRIIGARLNARTNWPLSFLADRLQDERRRLDELEIGDLAARSVLHVTYTALPDCGPMLSTARAFRLLSLAPGPDICLDAAAALLGTTAHRAEEALEALVDAHLIDTPAPQRYRLHDLVRLFAAEQAALSDPQHEHVAAVGRLATWYAHRADAATEAIAPSAQRILTPAPWPVAFASHDEAASWCARELENIVASVRQARDYGHYRTAWQLAASTWAYFRNASAWDHWLAAYTAGLEAARADADLTGQGSMLTGLGTVYRRSGDPDRSLSSYQQALTVYRRREGSEQRIGRVLNNIGGLQITMGSYEAALVTLREAMEIAERHDSPDGITLLNIAEALGKLGRTGEAIAALDEAAVIHARINDQYLLASGAAARGEIHLNAGQLDEAADAFTKSIRLRKSINYRHGIAQALLGLGDTQMRAGQPRDAKESWLEAHRIFQTLQDHPGVRQCEERLQHP